MKKTVAVASGEAVAGDLRQRGVRHVCAFNEAMCEGNTGKELTGTEFCRLRALAYGIPEAEYTHFSKSLDEALQGAERLELYFDHDMFCAVNTITLLAYLEEVRFAGELLFHLIAQDGTATVLSSFPIRAEGFRKIYEQVLVNRKPAETGVPHLDRGIALYLEYKQPENELTRFIVQNQSASRDELCVRILREFSDYGIGDVSAYRLIDGCRNAAQI